MNIRLRRIFGMVIAVLGLVFAADAMAQNAITSFNVTQQGGQIFVRMGFKEPLPAAPGSFTVANPARIAFDLPNTANELGRNSQEIGEGELRSVNVVQAGNRTRVVFNLRNMVQYDAKLDGKTMLITMTSGTGAAASRFADGRSDIGHALKTIGFRRGPTGEGRVVVDLSDASTGIDIRRQGQQIIIEFLKATISDNLRKRLDVVDFGTPVQSISTFPQGENVRMVIEPRGLWEHNAYQTDTQFVLEVKPVQYDANRLVQGTRGGYQGEKLSLNFQNIEVRSVLNVIADFTDLNIITSDTVQGNLTLRLKDVPWDQALDLILQTRGLDMRKNGNVVWIAPRDELATKEKLSLESQQQITELEALRTETFMLSFAKAIDVAKIVRDEKQSLLSKRGSAVIDARTNQLFVQDVPSRLEEVRRLIAKLDIAVRQVLIEARIVTANDTFTKNLGVRLGFTNSAINHSNPLNTSFQTGPTLETIGALPPAVVSPAATNPLNVNMAAGAAASPGSFAISLFNGAQTRFLNLEITALESDGKVKTVSNPRVLTTNNVEALIEQGTDIPYQTTSAVGTSTLFRKATLALRVKPQITPDGNVMMTLDVNKDEPGQSGPGGIAINTKHVKTEVLVDNGGTVVIGGIYTQDTSDTVNKVPLFGDLPYLGVLFRNTARSDVKTELLVFITPRVVQEQVGQR
jgi:type IV pilus assembly protein PilQ